MEQTERLRHHKRGAPSRPRFWGVSRREARVAQTTLTTRSGSPRPYSITSSAAASNEGDLDDVANGGHRTSAPPPRLLFAASGIGALK